MPLAGDPDPAWSGPSQLAASAAEQRRHRAQRARVRAYVLPAGRHRSELGSCRTGPPAHVRAGGRRQTDAIRAPSDRRRSDARRAPSRSNPQHPSAVGGHHRKALGNRWRFAGHGIHGAAGGDPLRLREQDALLERGLDERWGGGEREQRRARRERPAVAGADRVSWLRAIDRGRSGGPAFKIRDLLDEWGLDRRKRLEAERFRDAGLWRYGYPVRDL